MDRSASDYELAFDLLYARDPKGLELAVSFLEREPEWTRVKYYRSQLIYLILRSRLDFSSFIERLRALFLREFDDVKDHDGYWFPWSQPMVIKIASPEIRQKIAAHLDDPDPRIRRRAWLTSSYLEYSPIQEAQACLERLLSIKNEAEFQRNPTYSMVYQRFLDLARARIEIEEYHQRWQDEIISRGKQGEELSEAENREWLNVLVSMWNRFWGSVIWVSINRTGKKTLKDHDPVAIETALLFLEIDPYWGGSGYTKEWILDQLKYLELALLTPRLQNIMLHVIDTHYCREFKHYCKAARRIDNEEFRDALRSRLNSPDPNVVQRAERMLDFLSRYSNQRLHDFSYPSP